MGAGLPNRAALLFTKSTGLELTALTSQAKCLAVGRTLRFD